VIRRRVKLREIVGAEPQGEADRRPTVARRRLAAADLHLLPPGARDGGAVALTLRTLGGLIDRGDRARFPCRRRWRSAGAREVEDR
jgi:hypothetical protein